MLSFNFWDRFCFELNVLTTSDLRPVFAPVSTATAEVGNYLHSMHQYKEITGSAFAELPLQFLSDTMRFADH